MWKRQPIMLFLIILICLLIIPVQKTGESAEINEDFIYVLPINTGQFIP